MQDNSEIERSEDQMAEEKEKEVVRAHGFPCRSCGSQMLYSPEHRDLRCPYCESVGGIEETVVEAAEYLYFPDSDEYSAPKWEDMAAQSVVCPSCGAESVVAADVMTTLCPFCGSGYVTEPKESLDVIRPETVMPFRVSKERATALYNEWLRRRYMAPRSLKKEGKLNTLNGIYTPFFTFDMELSTDYHGFGGRRRIETYTVRVNGKTQTRTRTRIDWYPISGHEHLSFDDLPCCASARIDRNMLDQVAPFSLKMLNVYNPAYLAGFYAERYQMGLGEGFAATLPRVHHAMISHIERTRGYDTYRAMTYQHSYDRVRFKHFLLPVWVAAYNYRGRLYQFLVNGETGKIAGKAPVSVFKVLGIVAGVAALLSLILLIYYLSQ